MMITPDYFTTLEVACEFVHKCKVAASLWDKDERNAEYERGQVDFIRDSTKWSRSPDPEVIHSYILTLVDN